MKRSPLVRKTPLARKSLKPRATHPERTAQIGRIKRKATSKTALEKRHLERIAAMPCLVTGKRPVVVHHLMVAAGKRCRRDHRFVVPLIPLLHNIGWQSVHGIGCERKFELHHGLAEGFLIAWAKREWEKSCEGN